MFVLSSALSFRMSIEVSMPSVWVTLSCSREPVVVTVASIALNALSTASDVMSLDDGFERFVSAVSTTGKILPSDSEIDLMYFPSPPADSTSSKLIASRTAFGVAALLSSVSDSSMVPFSCTTPFWETVASWTVLFVAAITPLASWLMVAIYSNPLPDAVGSLTALCTVL